MWGLFQFSMVPLEWSSGTSTRANLYGRNPRVLNTRLNSLLFSLRFFSLEKRSGNVSRASSGVSRRVFSQRASKWKQNFQSVVSRDSSKSGQRNRERKDQHDVTLSVCCEGALKLTRYSGNSVSKHQLFFFTFSQSMCFRKCLCKKICLNLQN